VSRVGNKLISIPAGVEVVVEGSTVTVKGPKGTLSKTFNDKIVVKVEGNTVSVARMDEEKFTRSLHGTTRALLSNMVIGVSTGYVKTLDLVGVGYRAAAKGNGLTLALGYSHPIEIDEVAGITFRCESPTKIHVEGIEKEVVGQVAAVIRSKRPPEPYKGKGVKYSDEVIRRKEGKKA